MDDQDFEVQLIREWPVKNDNADPEGQETHSLKRKREDFYCGSSELVEQGGSKTICKISKQDKEQTANVALAKWWRRCGKNMIDRKRFPPNCNSNTLLSLISRTTEGREFISDEVKRLKVQLERYKQTCDVPSDLLAALGSYMEKFGQYEEAQLYLQTAVENSPDEKEYCWLLHKVKRQQYIKKLQVDACDTLDKHGNLKFPMPVKVDRVSADTLSLWDFFQQYASTSTPVIITDMVSKMTESTWDLNHIRDVAGECEAILRRSLDCSVEWARLEDCCTIKVRDFIDGLDSIHKEKYLFDWSLPIHCPALAKEITIPRYFAGDFLQRTAPGSLYQDSWPSLFVAGPRLHSDLHVDAFGSNFWMALFQGRKRWTFFPKKDLPFLYPKYEHSLDPVFDVDLTKPDLAKFPLLTLTHPTQCVLLPGELLFVPAGCPHCVENLDTTVAISANYADRSNFDLMKSELKINSLLDPRAEELLNQFENSDFDSSMMFSLKDLVWNDFKSCTEKK